jgi:hypothetical protein
MMKTGEGNGTMPASDLVVATLRAQLADSVDEHMRLLRQIKTDADKRAYATLINASFFEAIDRRFGEGAARDDAIEFVADVRSRSARLSDALDPRTGEQVILAAIGNGSIDELDPEELRRNQIILLAGMVADLRFDNGILDEFMAKARASADSLLG